MGRLEELIAEHCPDGVEYKKLGDIGTFVRGSGLTKKDLDTSGEPCIHYGQIHTQYYLETNHTLSYVRKELYDRLKKAEHGDVLLAGVSEDMEGVCKPVSWKGEGDVAISGDMFAFQHKQVPNYIVYALLTHDFYLYKAKFVRGAKVKRLSTKRLEEYRIPLPPIEVQNEIVRILDTFTELTQELTKELELRQKQYEFYRDALLTFEAVTTKRIGENI